MRIVILTLIGLISYLIIVIPGWFFLVPRSSDVEDTPTKAAEGALEDPGKEPPPK